MGASGSVGCELGGGLAESRGAPLEKAEQRHGDDRLWPHESEDGENTAACGAIADIARDSDGDGEGEQIALLGFLADALSVVPLPAPWGMMRDPDGGRLFVNRNTGETTRSNPLEPALRELAGVCRKCLKLQPTARKTLVVSMQAIWESEARDMYEQWCAVKHYSGRLYYCHRVSGSTMWEHPAEVLLPPHYMKIKAVGWLLEESYFAKLNSRQSTGRGSRDAQRSTDCGECRLFLGT